MIRLFLGRARMGRILALALIVFAASGAGYAAPAPASLSAALDHILDAPALAGGITGAIVVRVRDGKVLYGRNVDLRLLPASNRKLFTAASALGLLGDGFVYKTQVLAGAKPDSAGVVHGDVVLRGAGDGALTTADMDDLAAQMAAGGVKSISGVVMGDGSVFKDGPYGFGWEWDDLSDEEFPVIAALEVNDGDVHVHVVPGEPGKPAVVTCVPTVPYPPIDNQATTVAAGAANTCAVKRLLGQTDLSVYGELPVGASLDQNVPVADPGNYAVSVLEECLRARGIGIHISRLNLGSEMIPPPVTLAEHDSLPLAKYLPLMMKPSDNLIAECLIRTIGAVKGTAGTYDTGHALETPFFQSLGVDTKSIDLVDGCGVGRRNFVTARAMSQLLVGMAKRSDFGAYYDALPIAGVDGTLKTRMLKTRAAGNVHAKTGTLSQARGLSGYVTGPHGGLYAFSLLMNNFPGNARSAGDVQDAFVERLADTLPPGR